MPNWENPDAERVGYHQLQPLAGPLSIISFGVLLFAGVYVLAVLCSALRDPLTAIADWRAWMRGGSITVVDLCVSAILSPLPSANHTFQLMDWAFRHGWDMRWLRLAMWIAPAGYFAIALSRYEGRDPLIVAVILTVLTWLTALSYPKLGKGGRVASSL